MASDANKDEFLVAQYGAISDQVIHWDTFFWSKSQFFLAVEGVAVLGIGNWLVEKAQLLQIGPTQPATNAAAVGSSWVPFAMLAAAALLNIFLCIVWLRTGTRNRDFLNMRFEFGRAMEERLRLPGLYTYQHWKVDKRKLTGSDSHLLEILIPAAFGSVWLGLLAYVIAAYSPVRTSGSLFALSFTMGLWVVWIGLVVFCADALGPLFMAPPTEEGRGTQVWEEFQSYCREKGLV